jgi:hypothetical protein
MLTTSHRTEYRQRMSSGAMIADGNANATLPM